MKLRLSVQFHQAKLTETRLTNPVKKALQILMSGITANMQGKPQAAASIKQVQVG